MFRTIDVNINRICEGLRIIEDYLRFDLNDNNFKKLKDIKSFRFIIYELEKGIILNIENKIDFSLYLSLKIKEHKNKNIINILKNIHKVHKYSCLELEKEKISFKNFYELSLKIKNFCIDNNISLIIKNNIDIAKEINSNAIIIDENYLPFDIIKKNYNKKIGFYLNNIGKTEISNIDKYDFIIINTFIVNMKDKFNNNQILYKIDRELKES